MFYTQLVNFRKDECHISVSKNAKEACKLIILGFQFVTEEYNYEGKIFKKAN